MLPHAATVPTFERGGNSVYKNHYESPRIREEDLPQLHGDPPLQPRRGALQDQET
jgi:hypothetical protein